MGREIFNDLGDLREVVILLDQFKVLNLNVVTFSEYSTANVK